MSVRRSVVSIVTILAAALWTTGCSSSGKQAEESKQAVQSLSETRKSLESAKAQVDKTVASMNALNSGQDLKRNFERFGSEIAKTEQDAKRAKERADAMRAKSKQYIAKWEKEMADVKDPQLRASAEQRRARVQQNYDGIANAAKEARAAYEPFMQDLKDLQKALSVDLTPQGVTAAKPVMNRTAAAGKNLNRRIDVVIAELDKVMSGMTPTGQAVK